MSMSEMRNQFHLAILEVIAVVEAMLLVKGGDDVTQIRRGDFSVRELRAQLEALAVIPALRQSLKLLSVRAHAVLLQIAPATLDQFVDDGVDASNAGLIRVLERDDQRTRGIKPANPRDTY